MFTKIIVPVDLAHADRLERALGVAGLMAREHGAEICFVGVTSPSPGALGHTPEEYAAKLADFAKAQSATLGVTATSHAIVSHDPSTQLDRELEQAVSQLDGDLVVMQTHLPNVTDYFWSGHGAHLAAHSTASVMLVRG